MHGFGGRCLVLLLGHLIVSQSPIGTISRGRPFYSLTCTHTGIPIMLMVRIISLVCLRFSRVKWHMSFGLRTDNNLFARPKSGIRAYIQQFSDNHGCYVRITMIDPFIFHSVWNGLGPRSVFLVCALYFPHRPRVMNRKRRRGGPSRLMVRRTFRTQQCRIVG